MTERLERPTMASEGQERPVADRRRSWDARSRDRVKDWNRVNAQKSRERRRLWRIRDKLAEAREAVGKLVGHYSNL